MNLRKLIKKQEPKKKRRSKRGSYLVEAALTLPVFILCIVALALLIRVIGICENIIKGLDDMLVQSGVLQTGLGLTTFSDAFTFALLIVILIAKPTGLFGEKATDKV